MCHISASNKIYREICRAIIGRNKHVYLFTGNLQQEISMAKRLLSLI